MKRSVSIVIIALLSSCMAVAQKRPELGRSPMMGWNSWNWFERNVTEADIISIIDAMDSLRMQDLGYEYIVIDGGWRQDTLAADGSLVPHPDRFPNGIKSIADYAHAKGFKLGVHTVPGYYDCGCHPVGGWGHEELQMSQFVAWDLDFLKVDRCRYTLEKKERGWTEDLVEYSYRLWSKLIHDCGRDITFSISAYKYRDWYPELCNMARTTGDISHKASGGAYFEVPDRVKQGCKAVMEVVDINNDCAQYAGNGYWNDPDMLPIGDQGLIYGEQKSMFSLWCIMTSPLMLGNDPRNMSEDEWNLLSCRRALAINQDPTEQGRRIWSSADAGVNAKGSVVSADGATEVWCKHLSDGRMAVLLLNRAKKAKTITLSSSMLGLNRKALLRDVYTGEKVARLNSAITAVVPARDCLFMIVE